MILSHLLSQIALRRELHSIYNDLFTAGGPEIIFKTPTEYGVKEKKLSFKEIEDIVFGFGDTAMGIFRKSQGEKNTDELMLNPRREEVFHLGNDLLLVVMTTFE